MTVSLLAQYQASSTAQATADSEALPRGLVVSIRRCARVGTTSKRNRRFPQNAGRAHLDLA
jgi:hypothetical protein